MAVRDASGSAELQLREACLELERRLRAGADCSAEHFQELYPELWNDPETALELVFTEFVLRKQHGEQPNPESWHERFPQWRERLERLFQVHDLIAADAASVMRAADTKTSLQDATLPRSAEPTAGSPRHVGGYELLEEIARGGMGVVYQARQVGLKRIVALKLILSGEYAGSEQRRRFRREAEAAARLQHPNIVQIHEIGEQDGRPFLAMEYVDGISLDNFLIRLRAESRVAMPPRQAAALLETLAAATEHAHRHGVVHRDLKPANILLQKDEGGRIKDEKSDSSFILHDSAFVPKIADFGLAKLVDAQEATQSGALLGTPCYMAPEQAAGKEIGPAADVHGLGIMLYELLTGRVPFQGTTVEETLAQVRSAEPIRPCQLMPGIPRDLQTICLRCLQKEPVKRYGSAQTLAEDLGRFLRDEPILARPVGRLERTCRWCRRNPMVAALLTGIALLLALGTAVSIALAVWALNEGNQARKNAEQERLARQLADDRLAQAEKAVEDFLASMEKHPRLHEADFFDLRKQLLASALPFYDDFVKQKPGDAELEVKRGRAYYRMGLLRNQLGERKQGVADHQQAQAIFRKLTADFPSVVQYREELAASHKYLAYLCGNGSPAEAEAEHRHALAIYQSLAEDFPASREYRFQQLLSRCALSPLLKNQGKRVETEAQCQEVLTLYQSLAGEYSTAPGDRRTLAQVQFNVAFMLGDIGKHAEAEPIYREMLAIHKSLADRFPTVIEYGQNLASAHASVGYALLSMGKRAEAKAEYRQSLKLIHALAEKSPGVPYHQFGAGAMLNALADILKDEGELEEARRLYTQAITHQLVAYRTAPTSPMYTQGLRNPYTGLAEIALRQRDHTAAAEAATRLAKVRPDALGDAYEAAQFLARCVPLAEQDDAQPQLQRQALARTYADQAMQHLRAALRKGFNDTTALRTAPAFDSLRARPDFQKLIAEPVSVR